MHLARSTDRASPHHYKIAAHACGSAAMTRTWGRNGVALLCAVWIVQAAWSQQVFTQEALVQAGITRLGDIFSLAYGWAVVSTDGYLWDAAVLGAVPEQEPAWQLFVDEVPVDLRALGRANLSAVPVAIADVCQVVLHRQPALIGGVIAPSGAVHIRTCQAADGLLLQGAVEAGSETGDPGPFQYVESGDRNVDRTGPTAHGSLAFGGPGGHVRLGGLLDEHHATDPLIRPRVRTLYRGEKDARIHLRAASFDGASHRSWGTWAVRVAATRLEDLRFFERLGLEVPVNHDIVMGHLAGTWAARRVVFRLGAQRSKLTTRANPLDVDVAWRQTAVRGVLQRRWGERSAVGLRSAMLRTWGLGMRGHQLLLLHSAFVSARTQPAAAINLLSHVQVSLDGGALGWQVFAAAHHTSIGLRLTALWQWRAPAHTQGYAYWSSLGYRPSGLPPDDAPVLPPMATVRSADLMWQTGTARQLTLIGGLRQFQDAVMTTYTHGYDSLTTGLEGTARLAAASGVVATAAVIFETRLLQRLSAGAFGLYAYPISSAHPFRAAWHTRSLVQLHVRFRPNNRLSCFASLRYRGTSSWPDYHAAAQVAPSRYATALPAAAAVDLTIQKRFWHERLRVSATLRNLLNTRYRTHPGGAVSKLAFHVRAQYALRAFGS